MVADSGIDQLHSGDQGVLLTGATGFLGIELLARLLERTTLTVYAVVRAADQRQAEQRLRSALALALGGEAEGYEPRTVALQADVTLPDLGLGPLYKPLARRVSLIVHAGALVHFDRPLAETREVNVGGTRNLVRFARLAQRIGRLERFVYVSTAYVAGDYRGTFGEDQLKVGQRFRNSYERSKFEAECFLAEQQPKLPITILRPSIVVGEQESGWAPSFNALYWPLKLFARGGYLAVPGRADNPVDVVPLDFVADSIVHLSLLPEARGGTFHLTAAPNLPTVGEIAELAGRHFGRRPPPLIDPRLYSRLLHPALKAMVAHQQIRKTLHLSELFFPYFNASARFDNRRARIFQRDTGIEVRPFAEYFPKLVAFAQAAQWGRRPLPREGAARQRMPLRPVGVA